MKNAKFLSTCLGLMLAASLASTANAGLIVSGTEVTPGNYSFVFSQDASVDPLQTTTGMALSFAIDLPGITIFSPAGSMTDGTTTLSPTLFGWVDATLAAVSIDPNLITSANSGPLTISADAGIDLTTISWRFVSDEFFAGQPLTGSVQLAPPPGGAPEPSTLAIFGIGLLSLFGRRRIKTSPVSTR
jgi:hypothetical protein